MFFFLSFSVSSFFLSLSAVPVELGCHFSSSFITPSHYSLISFPSLFGHLLHKAISQRLMAGTIPLWVSGFFFSFFSFLVFLRKWEETKAEAAFSTLALVFAMITQKWVCRVDALVEVVLSSSQRNECVCLPREPRHSLLPRSVFDSVALL